MISLTDAPVQWFVLRGDVKAGPFEYHTMVKMMQDNSLHDNDYVWNPSLLKWTHAGDLADFSKDRMIRAMETMDEMKTAFNRRKTPRLEHSMPLYGHDNVLFFQGKTLDIGEGGGLLLLNTPMLQLNQEIFLHIKENPLSDVCFNARAKVVRKNFTPRKIHEKVGLPYAVQYLEVSGEGKKLLKKIMKDKSKEALK